MVKQGSSHMISSFSPVQLRGSSPLYMQNLPKCRNPLSEKPDKPWGVALDIKPSQITFVHAMWTHTSFPAIPTLRWSVSWKTLGRGPRRSTPIAFSVRGFTNGLFYLFWFFRTYVHGNHRLGILYHK